VADLGLLAVLLQGRRELSSGQAKVAVLSCAVLCCVASCRARNQMKQACLAAATYKTLVGAVPVRGCLLMMGTWVVFCCFV
jgi:hypothetical protein